MYAIAFDLDTEALKNAYHNDSYTNGYLDIRTVLGEFGFTPQQGSVYFGNNDVDAVQCVMAIMELTQRHKWFAAAVRDIRMLRIEDNNDLMPAVNRATGLSGGGAVKVDNNLKAATSERN